METEERREYKRKWYLKNKDTEEYKQRTKENKKLYRQKHKDTEEYKKKNREASKKAREQNRDYYIEYSKNYYKNNKDKWDTYNNKDSFICVYRFVSKNEETLRIGSTFNLKARVQNYMSNGIDGVKLKEWFQDYHLDQIEYILCSDRETAFMVEYNLIHKFSPLLNEKEVLEFEEWNEDVEDLWQTWEGLDYYKCKYKAMCNEDL